MIGVGVFCALPLAESGLDRGVIETIMLVVLLVICLGIHEAAHAWTALQCGDPTGRDLGRITLNPIPHIDPVMTVLLPAALAIGTQGRFIFGGAKPVPVSFHRLRHPWRDMSIVALAGPGSNLILAVLFVLLWKLFVVTGWYNGASEFRDMRPEDLLPVVMWKAAQFNVVLALFNMIPIPPLDGSRVMAWLLPESLRPPYLSIERFGIVIIMLLLYTSPVFGRMLYSSVSSVLGALQHLVELGGLW